MYEDYTVIFGAILSTCKALAVVQQPEAFEEWGMLMSDSKTDYVQLGRV